MQFLYYRPGHNRKVTLDDVKRWGLEYAFDKPPVCGECQNRTPDGNSGRVFLCSNSDGEVPQVNLEKQTWRKLPGERMGEAVWVGVWNEAKPGPDELERSDSLPGYQYETLDGSLWTVPLVRDYAEGNVNCHLPCLMDYDDSGKPTKGAIVEKYRKLWALTEPLMDDLLSQYGFCDTPENTISEDEVVRASIDLLSANYRVGIAELVLLEALPSGSVISRICALACDWPRVELYASMRAESKKNSTTAAGASTPDGGAD